MALNHDGPPVSTNRRLKPDEFDHEIPAFPGIRDLKPLLCVSKTAYFSNRIESLNTVSARLRGAG